MLQRAVSSALTAFLLTSVARADDAEHARPAIDPKADAWLKKMSTSLASMQTFQFDAEHMLEVVEKSGEKLQFVARSRVSVQRPDKLRSDRLGAFADAALFYDGKTITIYGKRVNMYATAAAPGNLDQAIDFARERLELEAPAADLLYADAYKGLIDNVESGVYVGNEPIGDRMCHHLAFRAKGTDWQIWVEDSPRALPCRYVITSTDLPSAPEFAVSFTSWNLAPKLASDEFAFKPPKGATKIDFLDRRTP